MSLNAINDVENAATVFLHLLTLLRYELKLERQSEADYLAHTAAAMFQSASDVETAVVGSPSFARILESGESELAHVIMECHSELLRARNKFLEAAEGSLALHSFPSLAIQHLDLTYARIEHKLSKALGFSRKHTPRSSVFVFHSSSDKDFVRKLCRDLSTAHLDVWFDEWEMLPGDSLYDKIQKGIQRASWFIIVLSPSSVNSSWCKRELHQALAEEFDRNGVFVVPVLNADCEIPGFLKEKVWADCREQYYEQGLRSLFRRFGVDDAATT